MNGLQADYAALIEKRNAASLSYTKEGRRWAESLLRSMGTATTHILLSALRTILLNKTYVSPLDCTIERSKG